MRRARRVVHAHATRYNVGDDAIVIAAHDLLRRHLPGGAVEVIDVTRDPFQRPGEPIVGFLPLYQMHRPRYWPRVVLEFLRADLLLVGGGELIAGSVEFPGLTLIAAAAGVPVLYFGVGANMSRASRLGRGYARLALRVVRRIVLRDDGARSELERLGVDPGKIVAAADVVFSLWRHPCSSDEDLPPHEARRRTVGVSIRHLGLPVTDETYRLLAGALDRVVETCDADLLLVPFLGEESPFETSGAAAGEATDTEALGRCRDLMTHRERAVLYCGDRDPRTLLQVLAGLDAMIAMRLHASVLALIAGVMPVAIGYAPKVRRVLQTAGVEETVIDSAVVEPERLAALTLAVIEKRTGFVVDGTRIERLRALAELNGVAMAEVIAPRTMLRIVGRCVRIPLVLAMLAVHCVVTAYAASDSRLLKTLAKGFRSLSAAWRG